MSRHDYLYYSTYSNSELYLSTKIISWLKNGKYNPTWNFISGDTLFPWGATEYTIDFKGDFYRRYRDNVFFSHILHYRTSDNIT